MDSIFIGETAHILPPGYKISLSFREKSNKMTMSNGEVRIDLGSRRWKAKITYETATQSIFDKILEIREKSLSFEEIVLSLKKQNGTQECYSFNIILPPSFQVQLRQSGLYLYNNLSIELE